MLSILQSKYNSLCSPARVYLIITAIWVILTIFMNGNVQENITCTLAYSFVWILILNLLCKKSEKLAWAIFLLPIFFHILILMAVMCFLGSATAEIIFDEEDCDCNK
jgi:hypothetical protein